MSDWQMSVPNNKDGTPKVCNDRRPSDDPFYQVGATFASPNDEHYYGLGQNHEGYLDRRGHAVRCAHDYTAPAGPSVCVPFVVTNKGYGLLWDNPGKTTAQFGFNEVTRWTSDVGQRVSFFVIAGKTYDEIYEGYNLLTGDVPMLPKSAYGYIQCKQRYTTQAELMAVAKGYRDRHLPADVLVIDWFHYTKMGEMDMDPAKWPDPVAMNRELHAMNFHTMISVWPRFVPEDRYYKTVFENGWFIHKADGTPINGLPYDRAGSDIDTTNPDAAKWYWNVIRENYVAQGLRCLLGGRDRTRSAAQWQLLPRWTGHGVLQCLSAIPYGCVLQWNAPRHERAGADSCSRCVSGRTTQRHNLLVVGHLPHMGHAEASNSHWH